MQNKTELRKLSDLKKLPNNPRTIKTDSFEKLCESLKNSPDYFEARPLILSDRTGELIVIAGNQRYEAAKANGLKEVPTYLLSGLTEEKEREIIIRDNVNNGEWDWDVLANQWNAEDLESWGLDAWQHETGEGLGPDGNFGDDGISASDQFGVIVICGGEAEQEAAYGALQKLGYTCKVVVT